MARLHLADADFTLSPHNATEYTVDVSAGVIEEMPRRERVVIYGAGIGNNEAPLDDPTCSVWALNIVAPYDSEGRLRCDRWFDIHQRVAQSDADKRWIARCPVPIYVPDDLMDLSPVCVRFPFERLERTFGRSYWTCTFAYQIALALMEGYQEIGLYGVEVAYGTARERSVEWACVSWWMGFATAHGVKFHVPTHSLLGRHFHRYGLEYTDEKTSVETYLELVGHFDMLRKGAEGMGG